MITTFSMLDSDIQQSLLKNITQDCEFSDLVAAERYFLKEGVSAAFAEIPLQLHAHLHDLSLLSL